ncbi:MAG TPA: hypothetical protein VJH95_01925 [Candidatus Nanoarchaeia archaeon]|nr:hypothetical protein [Candidatus Nanoarchaeia archaeon]
METFKLGEILGKKMFGEDLGVEKAHIMFKLARKNNWGGKYDRLEHFKRFKDLSRIVKELAEGGWILIHRKSTFTGIALNTEHKREIVEFIEKKMPYVKGMI